MSLGPTLIASANANSGSVSNFVFSSIPQTYTDLLLKISVRSGNSGSQANLGIQLNSTTTGYYGLNLVTYNGSSVQSQADSNDTASYSQYTSTNGMTSGIFGNADIYIPKYTGSTQKILSGDFVTENSGTTANYTGISSSYCSGFTAAITSLTILSGANLQQYSTAYLYGISKS